MYLAYTHLFSRVFLKFENLQPSGSFKSRGIGNLIRSVLSSPPYSCSPSIPTASDHKIAATTAPLNTPPDTNPGTPHKPHFYSSSGGNAGLACVTAAVSLGCPATVVVPLGTSPLMIARIKSAGATNVIAHGESWKEADAYLKEEVLTRDDRGVYVPPFDDERVWDGNSTLITELRQQMPSDAPPDAIVCSVGGGGLFAGVMRGLERHPEWSATQVLATETAGADSLHASLKAGELVTLDKITSIATSLGARRVAAQAFSYAHDNPETVKSVVLSDAEAAQACVRFADDERVMVEPACGVSVALAYDGRLKELLSAYNKTSRVVIIVCGGSHVTVEKLGEWRKLYGSTGERQMGVGQQLPSSVSAP